MQFKIGNNFENVSVYNVVKNIEEELDNGSIVIPFSTRSNRYQPFTLVDVTLDDESHEYWYIDSSKVKPVDQKERTKYRHEITLIEITKILERYPIPSRSFVQLSTGTKFTLLDVVNNLIETVPFDDTFNYTNTRIIDSVDPILEEYLDIESPDIFLTDRTLKEAFVEVFKVINAYPRLTINELGETVLTADYYNELAEFVNKETGISNKEEQQSSNNYATSFNVVGSNMIYSYDKIASSIVEPTPTGWIGLRSEGSLLIIDKAKLYLQDQIEELVKVELQYVERTQSGTTLPEPIVREFDITDYVVENEVRRTLISNPYNLDENSNSIKDLYEGVYQANTLSYTQGSNTVEGFEELYRPDLASGSDKTTLHLLIRTVQYRDGYVTTQTGINGIDEPLLEDVRFRVRYIPKITARQFVERNNLSEFNTKSTLIAGQSDAFLASDKLLDNMFSRINRTGSAEVLTSVFNATEEYPIGSYTTDGYILTSSERVMYPDHYDIQYKWTKDFQKVSDFLSLNSEPKLFEIQSTLVRNEVFSQYCIIDTSSVEDNSYLSEDGYSVFINTIRPTPLTAYNKPIYAVAFQSAEMAVEAVYKPVVSYAGGNSLNFWFGFDSPFVAGQKLEQETDLIYRNKAIYYTDDDGRLTDFNAFYVNDMTIEENELPIVATPETYLIDARGFKTNKNQSEILAMTYQLVVTAQQGLDVLIGDKFLKDNNLISDHSDGYETLEVRCSENRIRNTKNVKYEAYTKGSASISYDAELRKITVSGVDSDEYWAICNADGETYLICNELETYSLYFNMRNDRQDSSYAPGVPVPTNLQTTAGSEAIFFDWDDAGQSDSFVVRIVETETGTLQESTITTNTYYNFTDLDPDTEYTLSVRAELDGLYSAYANTTATTTLGAPLAPSWIDATVINSTTIDVEWEQVEDEQYYQVAWSTNNVDWYDTQTNGANDTTYTYDDLSPSTTYYFRVRAGNAEYGDSDWFSSADNESPYDTTWTTPTPSPTTAPTINYISQGEDYIYISLTNNDSREVDVYYEVDDSTPDARVYNNISAGSTTGYIFYGGIETGSHTMYARAYADGADGSSVVSYPFTLTTTTSPDAPLNFQVQSILLNDIFFQWTDNSTNEDGFVIELHTNSSFTNLYDSFTTNANAQTGIIDSVASGTYYARIKAYNTIGDSAWVSCSDNPITI